MRNTLQIFIVNTNWIHGYSYTNDMKTRFVKMLFLVFIQFVAKQKKREKEKKGDSFFKNTCIQVRHKYTFWLAG